MKKLALMLMLVSLVSVTAKAMEEGAEGCNNNNNNYQMTCQVVPLDQVKKELREGARQKIFANYDDQLKEDIKANKSFILEQFKSNTFAEKADQDIREAIVEEGRKKERGTLSWLQRHPKKFLLGTLAFGVSLPFALPVVLEWLKDGGTTE